MYKTTQSILVVPASIASLLTRLVDRRTDLKHRQGRRGSESPCDSGDLRFDEESDTPIATNLEDMRDACEENSK